MIASWKKHVQHGHTQETFAINIFCFYFLLLSVDTGIFTSTSYNPQIDCGDSPQWNICDVLWPSFSTPRFTNKLPVKLIQIVWN